MNQSADFQILLIDDHPSDAKLFQHAMEQAASRAQLYWVATAEEGLEFLKGEGRFQGVGPARLVVTDLNMPGMDGFDFIREARRTPALATTPIVVFSSSRSPQDVLHCYRLGANSFITKPMSLEGFVTAIGTLVRYWLDIVQLPDAQMID